MTESFGVLVIGLSILSVGIAIVLTELAWRRDTPSLEHAGIRYELRPGCIEWQDLHPFFDKILALVSERHPGIDLLPLWIVVHPYGEVITTSQQPTGYLNDGAILIGLTEWRRKYPLSRPTAIVHVRQHRPRDTQYQARAMTGESPIVATAKGSVLAHEIIEHVLSSRLGRGSNWLHTDRALWGLAREAQK